MHPPALLVLKLDKKTIDRDIHIQVLCRFAPHKVNFPEPWIMKNSFDRNMQRLKDKYYGENTNRKT